MQIQAEQFTVILQDSLTSMEKYFENLIAKSFTPSIIQNIQNYSAVLKKRLTEEYNNLSDEIKHALKGKFDEIVKKSDMITRAAIDRAEINQRIFLVSNDIFYNDITFVYPEKKNGNNL